MTEWKSSTRSHAAELSMAWNCLKLRQQDGELVRMTEFSDSAESNEQFRRDAPRKVTLRPAARCRLEAHINKAKESISFCSAVMRPVFTWSSTNILTILFRRGSLIWIQYVIGPVTSGMFGYEALPRDISMVIASKGPINRKKAIASTRADCFWIRMQEQLPELKIGIS